MSQRILRIALAALKHPDTLDRGLDKIDAALKQASSKGAEIACFPETYLPGLRGFDIELPPPDQQAQERALKAIRSMARAHGVAVIVGMERVTPKGLLNVAQVVSAKGRSLGYQAKNQIMPGGESANYSPDGKRRLFTVGGVKFGIVICHEGWRYPETVRWATTRGAQIIFQPQVTGSDLRGKRLKKWGESFYEKAMMCRAEENSVYFASVNTTMRFQNSATSLIDPTGMRMAWTAYGKEQVLVRDLDLSKATRLYAKRFRPDLYEGA